MTWQSTLKVSISGVRGIVGESLTMKLVSNFATAFGTYVGQGRVVIGRDTRPTGEMIQHAVVSGLISVGCEPILADVLPTPSILMLVQQQKAKGGICITASHNPNQWNALKFVGPDGLFLNSVEATELLNLYNQESHNYYSEVDYRDPVNLANPFQPHLQRILNTVDLHAIQNAKIKVAVDCCNGAGAKYSEDFLRGLGCEVIVLNNRADGIFSRGPEPIPENLKDLSNAVREHGCALGFAQDPDCDRLAMVDSNGEPLGESTTLTLAIDHILSKQKGPVVINLSTSKAIEDVVTRAGCELFYSKIGEINVTEEMMRRGAIIGGEGNGGVIWPAIHPCRDSYCAMALILEMMAHRKQGINQIMKNIPRYASSSLKLACTVDAAQHCVRALREEYSSAKINTLDGIRIDWDDRWVLIRPSNTEPIMRVFAEAPSQAEADALGQELLEKCQKLAGL